jgi:hypothetical protein
MYSTEEFSLICITDSSLLPQESDCTAACQSLYGCEYNKGACAGVTCDAGQCCCCNTVQFRPAAAEDDEKFSSHAAASKDGSGGNSRITTPIAVGASAFILGVIIIVIYRQQDRGSHKLDVSTQALDTCSQQEL